MLIIFEELFLNNTMSDNLVPDIKQSFFEMQTKQDLLNLLNYVKPMVYGSEVKPFTFSQLNYNAHNSINPDRYRTFTIKKKSGKDRVITAPNPGLKAFQKCLNYVFQLVYTPNAHAYGFIPGKSVVDNASVHIGQNYVYNIDLKDFFPSNESGRLYKRLQSKPLFVNAEVASVITDLCCHPMEVERLDENGNVVRVIRSVLPQGAPTSPTLTNILCESLDFKLTKLAKKYGLNYSRYADDITFSSKHNVYQDDSKFIMSLRDIINKSGYIVNKDKTRLQKSGARQEVTGLVVSQNRVNVTKKYIRELRGMLFIWEKYGLDILNEHFIPRYLVEKGHVKKNNPNVISVISGKLMYLRMVRGEGDSKYAALQARFDQLTNKGQLFDNRMQNAENKETLSENELENVMSLLEKSGFDLSVLDKNG